MVSIGDKDIKLRLAEGLGRIGLRPTRQRELVYELLVAMPDHPSAEDIFARARRKMSSISLATIYNCLETLVDSGLVQAVHRERSSTRYCANPCEHAHFHDSKGGRVADVVLPQEALQYLRSLVPQGYVVERVELNYIGHKDEQADGSAH